MGYNHHRFLFGNPNTKNPHKFSYAIFSNCSESKGVLYLDWGKMIAQKTIFISCASNDNLVYSNRGVLEIIDFLFVKNGPQFIHSTVNLTIERCFSDDTITASANDSLAGSVLQTSSPRTEMFLHRCEHTHKPHADSFRWNRFYLTRIISKIKRDFSV